MPRVLGDEYRSAFLKNVTYIVQYENSAAFQNAEGFIHFQVSVDRNACTEGDLLGPQGETVGACRGADLDIIDVAVVAKMNEMFPSVGPSTYPCGAAAWAGGTP